MPGEGFSGRLAVQQPDLPGEASRRRVRAQHMARSANKPGRDRWFEIPIHRRPAPAGTTCYESSGACRIAAVDLAQPRVRETLDGLGKLPRYATRSDQCPCELGHRSNEASVWVGYA